MSTYVGTELIDWVSFSVEQMNRYLNLVKARNMNLIIARINAFSDWRSNSNSIINKIDQFIPIANAMGIDVSVDFHTWWSTWDNYFDDQKHLGNTNPVQNRVTYINYIKDSLNKMRYMNVHSFQLINEPQYQTASASEGQFLIDLLLAGKEITYKPLSLRFMGGASPYGEDGQHYPRRIAELSDYYCINSYIDCRRNPPSGKHGCTASDVMNTVNQAHADGKELWVTEFGCYKDNTATQATYVEAWIDWAKRQDIDKVFCWVSKPVGGSGERFNLFNGWTPNPAWYKLNNPEPEPIPEPPIPPEDPDPPIPEPIDLENYYTKQEINTILNNYYTKQKMDLLNTALNTRINGVSDIVLSNLEDIKKIRDWIKSF